MKTGLPSQIIGSFEDIGKDVLKQAASVPKDVVGKALESLGTSSGQKQTPKAQQGPLADLEKEKEEKNKKAIARAALAQIAGEKPKQKEPSVWERLQMEMEQKRKEQKNQQAQQAQQQLPKVQSKRPRGDLYGLKAKKASSEMSRNVRQD